MAQDTASAPRAHSYGAAKALIIFLFALFVAMLVASLWRGWADAERRAEDRAVSAAQVVGINARWIAELSRQALLRIDDALGADIRQNAPATGDLIREAVSQLPGNVKSYVVAADGRTLFSTDPQVQPIDVRDRPYFAELEAGAYWYTSQLLVSRLNGDQIFVFSKRLQRQGEFAGAAILSFDVELLREVWFSLDLGQNSAVGFLRDDGQLVARYPLAEGPLDMSQDVLFTTHLKEADHGFYRARSPADGEVRIIGYRTVPGTDLIAAASIDADTIFRTFRRNAAVTLVFAVPTALALAFAIAWIFRLLRNDQERQRRLAEANDVNRMLVRDTHHRVKNNLQAIMSMVRMHGLPDNLKLDLQNRIAAMSAVHEHLYRLDQFSEVNVSTLIPGIVDPIRDGYGTPVEIVYDIDSLQVDHDHATPLALLVSELVTNALKYAYAEGEDGKVVVSLKAEGETGARLTVSDEGIGIDREKPSQGLGSRLIKAMVIQLGGTGGYADGPGTVFEAELTTGFKRPA